MTLDATARSAKAMEHLKGGVFNKAAIKDALDYWEVNSVALLMTMNGDDLRETYENRDGTTQVLKLGDRKTIMAAIDWYLAHGEANKSDATWYGLNGNVLTEYLTTGKVHGAEVGSLVFDDETPSKNGSTEAAAVSTTKLAVDANVLEKTLESRAPGEARSAPGAGNEASRKDSKSSDEIASALETMMVAETTMMLTANEKECICNIIMQYKSVVIADATAGAAMMTAAPNDTNGRNSGMERSVSAGAKGNGESKAVHHSGRHAVLTAFLLAASVEEKYKSAWQPASRCGCDLFVLATMLLNPSLLLLTRQQTAAISAGDIELFGATCKVERHKISVLCTQPPSGTQEYQEAAGGMLLLEAQVMADAGYAYSCNGLAKPEGEVSVPAGAVPTSEDECGVGEARSAPMPARMEESKAAPQLVSATPGAVDSAPGMDDGRALLPARVILRVQESNDKKEDPGVAADAPGLDDMTGLEDTTLMALTTVSTRDPTREGYAAGEAESALVARDERDEELLFVPKTRALKSGPKQLPMMESSELVPQQVLAAEKDSLDEFWIEADVVCRSPWSRRRRRQCTQQVVVVLLSRTLRMASRLPTLRVLVATALLKTKSESKSRRLVSLDTSLCLVKESMRECYKAK